MEPIYSQKGPAQPRHIQVANDFVNEILAYQPIEQNEMIALIREKIYNSRVDLIAKLESEARLLHDSLDAIK